MRYSKSIGNVLLYEVLHVSLPDLGKSFGLRPFSEIIDGYHHELLIGFSRWQWSNNAHPLLYERPGDLHKCH